MNRDSSISHLKIFLSRSFKFFFTNKLLLILLIFFYLLIISCSPTKRFTETEQKSEIEETTDEKTGVSDVGSESNRDFSDIRVSIHGIVPDEKIVLGSPVELYNENEKLALVKPGNTINIFHDNSRIRLVISEQEFNGEKFQLYPVNSDQIIKLNGKRYRGKIQLLTTGNSIEIINILSLEDYVRGVLAKEMPVGKGEENLEALKALAVCVRTYAIQKMKDGKVYFDIYADTRDQVYGGVDAESPLSNKATEETKDEVLKYEGNSAQVFYHSTCGGYTESAENVFTNEEIPYLVSVKDGNEPNCLISPRFSWEEKYTRELIVERLLKYSLVDNINYELDDIEILSRFSSGRVDELQIDLENDFGESKTILLKGNEIRSVIRTADGKSILWSTMFDISISSNYIILSGNGFGHGVGLCQWGAIALSKKGQNYGAILEHYFPGTTIDKLND